MSEVPDPGSLGFKGGLVARWAMPMLLASVAILSSAEAAEYEPDRPRGFSLGVSVGLLPDMAGLGNTITMDGTIDTADSTMANLAYGTGKAIMSDRDNEAIWHNSQNTDSAFRMLGAEPTLGGAMLGIELGTTVQYEFDQLPKRDPSRPGVPLFVRSGFNFLTRMAGGQQTRTLGDIAARSPDLANLLLANGETPSDYTGGTMHSNYGATWFEVPLSVGVKIPVFERAFVYGFIGVSLFHGGFKVSIDVDEAYANVLCTHVDTDALTVANYSPGAVQEDVWLRMTAVGLNWGLGAQARIAKNLGLYLELNFSGAAKTVYSSALKPETRRLLTATSSESLAQDDPEWFKRIAYPVLAKGASVRIGVRIYLF